ncbi:MAG: histidine kinase dimerization/phospho-acceptor domain-containing protein, partial [Gammaproteobacteria bacterium]
MADPTSPGSGDAGLIEQLRRDNESLRAELEETNQGVLALYAELDTQAEQLRQASDLKSRFLSYMSHEFRTPLGSILSITRLLSDELDGPLSPEQHKQVRFVSSAASELSEMVDDLLDLSRITKGKFDLRKLPSDEPGMSPLELWCNESQERYVLAIPADRIDTFATLCARERAPFAVVGEAT